MHQRTHDTTAEYLRVKLMSTNTTTSTPNHSLSTSSAVIRARPTPAIDRAGEYADGVPPHLRRLTRPLQSILRSTHPPFRGSDGLRNHLLSQHGIHKDDGRGRRLRSTASATTPSDAASSTTTPTEASNSITTPSRRCQFDPQTSSLLQQRQPQRQAYPFFSPSGSYPERGAVAAATAPAFPLPALFSLVQPWWA